MKIGILSGTFDPVHEAHIELAKTAKNNLGLDRVVFLIEKTPRHKTNVTDYVHRLNMLKLVLEPGFFIQENPKDQHDIDILHLIKSQIPEAELYFLVGADVALNMPSWKDIDKIRELTKIIVFGRGELPSDLNLDHPASSKKIRDGQGDEFIDERVLKYIYDHKLYTR